MKKIFAAFIFNSLFLTTFSQATFWKFENEQTVTKQNTQRIVVPQVYKTVSLSIDDYKSFLQQAPKESSVSIKNGFEISVPYPDGSFKTFRIVETRLMEDALSAEYRGIKTFTGQGIDNPSDVINIDYTYQGFHAYIISPQGAVYIDPYERGNNNLYITYYSKDYLNPAKENFICSFYDASRVASPESVLSGTCIGTQLKTYRTAIACTGEYAVAVCPPGNVTKANTLSQIVTTINRVTGVYQTELGIKLLLVATEGNAIFTNATTDPFKGNSNPTMLSTESQRVIDSAIGNANYDIGHTFSTGGGGLASLRVVCVTGTKAMGVTGTPTPVGDNYDIDYVAHEMGHQFGANHTFESESGFCSGNRNILSAYEPGSGSSIMGYAGICSSDDLQPHTNPYFHTKSFDEIVAYITTGNGKNCPALSSTGNNPPVVIMPASDVKIPLGTPFTLTGSATDPDNNPLTYSWEEWDLSNAASGSEWDAGATSTVVPLFKSRPPKTTGARTFPDLAIILAGFPASPAATMNGLKGETLPLVARDIKFRLTVRDNNAGGGGVATGGEGCSSTAPFKVIVTDDGPFDITYPNTAVNWPGLSLQTVTWNIANTNAVSGINCQKVNILMSADGGLTYFKTLAAMTPNDGSETIQVPNIPNNSTVRIKVEAADNIFFDISDVNFSVTFISTLPVSFLNFSAIPSRDVIDLRWSTSSEHNNSNFEVMRSEGTPDNFLSIGSVNSAGNSSVTQDYSFTDAHVLKGVKYFYRIQQNDINNAKTLSDIKSGFIAGNDKLNIALRPQPFENEARLELTGLDQKDFNLIITDITGRIVTQQKIINTIEARIVPINLTGKTSGTYIIKIVQGNKIKTLKALKR